MRRLWFSMPSVAIAMKCWFAFSGQEEVSTSLVSVLQSHSFLSLASAHRRLLRFAQKGHHVEAAEQEQPRLQIGPTVAHVAGQRGAVLERVKGKLRHRAFRAPSCSCPTATTRGSPFVPSRSGSAPPCPWPPRPSRGMQPLTCCPCRSAARDGALQLARHHQHQRALDVLRLGHHRRRQLLLVECRRQVAQLL